MPKSILLVDDEENILNSLTRVLKPLGYTITSCQSPLAALELVRNNSYQLVISDQRMPDMSGIEFLAELEAVQPRTRRILMSAHADFTDITAAFNSKSIHHFVPKPCASEVLRDLVVTQLELYESVLDTKLLKGSSSDLQIFHGIVSSDPEMLVQIDFIKKVANFGAPFTLYGETGTGKELFARAIHNESARKNEKFIAINCANLTENLLESQLFGHVKGAFTGADNNQQGLFSAANKGTLFLDEITEIPLGLQAKLLRVLQEKEFTPLGETTPIKVDVQIISAASLSLKDAVAQGLFRDDLHYRLDVLPINIPPLRQREGDIEALFEHLLSEQLQASQVSGYKIEAEVYRYIKAYSWPGNVRELLNVCTYIAAVVESSEGVIAMNHLPKKITSPESTPSIDLGHASAKENILLDKETLLQVLEDMAGSKTATAKYFGVSRMTLWRRMKDFNLLS